MSLYARSRGLLALTLLALFLDLTALTWVVYAAYTDRDALVQIRSALFT